MKFLSLFLLLSFSTFAEEAQIDPKVAKRIESIKNYSSPIGEWSGEYFIKSAPEELLEKIARDGVDKSGIGVKVILREKTADVYFKFTPVKGWTKSDAQIQVVPDKLGWQIYLTREGGYWLERIWLSVARTKENVGALTVTRTVHNWYGSGNSEVRNYYYMFGAGELKKI